MSTTAKASPEITRAAERYLEQYGDPLVMNTYLKITILVLAVVCLTLAALTFESQKSLANMHPMIVRINDVGRQKRSTIATFNTVLKKQKTSITSRAGPNSTLAAIVSQSNAIRRALSTS